MAENENGQEKTEEATPRRMEKAREEGQIARSRELNTTFVLLGGVGALILLGGDISHAMRGMMAANFSLTRDAIFDAHFMQLQLLHSALASIQALLPFFSLMLAAALIGPVALGGFLFSAKALAPKFSRLDPVKGLARMFSMTALVELIKGIGKFLLVAGIAIFILTFFSQNLLSLGHAALEPAIFAALKIVGWSVLAISASMIVISAIDVPYQLFDHAKKMKMTLQELKDEMKDSEGKPEVKGRIRQLQREMANRRMMEAVPQADVVITNPEHFSVALKYDPNSGGAPVVLAKGVDHMAIKIREIANAHQVMIIPSPILARAVYFTTELDKEIPGDLYLAVAQVLAYVFQLKAHREGSGRKPRPLAEIQVPVNVQYGSDGKPIRRH